MQGLRPTLYQRSCIFTRRFFLLVAKFFHSHPLIVRLSSASNIISEHSTNELVNQKLRVTQHERSMYFFSLFSLFLCFFTFFSKTTRFNNLIEFYKRTFHFEAFRSSNNFLQRTRMVRKEKRNEISRARVYIACTKRWRTEILWI